MQEKIRTKPLNFRASRSAKQQMAANGVRERRSACIPPICSWFVSIQEAGSERCAKRSIRGPSAARQPGTHEHRPLEYGFRACRCAAPRNDDGLCRFLVESAASGPSPAGLAGIRSGRKVPRARPCAGHPRLPWQARDNVKTWMPGPSPGTGDFLDAGCGANSGVNGLRPVQSAGNTALAEARTRHRDTERAKEL
jgi:hypothetical protein